MKKGKKIIAVLTAALIVLACTIPAFAAEPEQPGITIDNAVNGETYTAYLLLKATYEGELGEDSQIAYYYEGAATDALYGLMTGAGLQFDAFVNGRAYLKVQDAEGAAITYTETQIRKLASDINTALHADPPTLELEEAGHKKASGGSATIDVTAKGLYFVDTTLGSICSIDTAGKAKIYEKNSVPTLKKEAKEDTDGNWYTYDGEDGKFVTAAFDDEVEFRLTVNTGTNTYAPEAEEEEDPDPNGVDADYVIVDEIPAGMAYVAGSAASGTQGITVSTENAVWDPSANTLTITLDADEVAALGQDADIVITYKAAFTNDAAAEVVYTNTATLSYQEQTSTSTAAVKSYQFVINKINDAKEPEQLAGVTFSVSRTADGKYLNSEGAWVSVAQGAAAPVLTTDANGQIYVSGIDDDTYTVTEVGPLDGYNPLDAPVVVVVALDGTVTVQSGVATAEQGVITIVNLSGTVLPSTGGIGTTLFYVIGAVLVAGAIVLLLFRRRAHK